MNVRDELPTEDEMSIKAFLEKSKRECDVNMKKLQSRQFSLRKTRDFPLESCHPHMTSKIYDNLPFIIFVYQLHDEFYILMDLYYRFEGGRDLHINHYPNCPVMKLSEHEEALHIQHTMDLKIFILHIIYQSIQQYGDLLEMMVLKKKPFDSLSQRKMTSSSFSFNIIQIMDFLIHSYENIEEIGFESILQLFEINEFTHEDVSIFMNKMMNIITSVKNLKEYLFCFIMTESCQVKTQPLMDYA